MTLKLYYLFVIAFSVSHAIERLYVNDKLLRIQPLTQNHVTYLQTLENTGTYDFWTEVTSDVNRATDVHVTAHDYDHFISGLKQFNIPFEVVADDLQKLIDDEQHELEVDKQRRQFQATLKSRLNNNGETVRADITGTYASYREMTDFMEDLQRLYPSNVRVLDMGLTVENRQTKVISIQFNPASTRNIWFDCGIHAREWITQASCIWLINQLIDDYNNKVPTIVDLLNYWTVYVAPSLNPDGYEFSRTNTRLWRKNRNTNSGSTCIGTDLNRNFARMWMTGGASNQPCSETYGGRAAESEPETKNMVKFLTDRQGTWDMYMSIHSYGQWWFTPYGYTYNYPADYTKQLALARLGADAIRAENGRVYTSGTVSNLLYIASGSTCDWAYDILGIIWSFTIELPPTSSNSATGFVLPPNLAPEVCAETYKGLIKFLTGVKSEVTSSN